MFSILSRRRNTVLKCLLLYCTIFGCYVIFFAPNALYKNGNHVQVGSASLINHLEIEKEEIVSKVTIDQQTEKQTTLSKQEHTTSSYNIPSNLSTTPFANFSFSKGLKIPAPGFQLGHASKNADVIVGIPTVKRDGVSYLEATIESMIIKQTTSNIDTAILVYIGETDKEFVQKQAETIQKKFPNEIENGKLEIISPPSDYYPNWNLTLAPSFEDSLQRVKWRSKQNLDQIFLLMYIYNLSPKYYLMMEDDVIASDNYMDKIIKFATSKSEEDYFYISFCTLGAIGKLFRLETLPSYASFIYLFWNKKPLDWLQIDYVSSTVCSYDESAQKCYERRAAKMPLHKPSLFQHVGKISSLEGKTQNMKDPSFKL